MARYEATIRTPWSPEAAFAYMADLRNFERWDPGVSSSTMVAGTEPGPTAAYDVKVTGTELRYETLEYTSPKRTAVEAKTTLLRSYDIIEITPTDDGCDVRYDATLELNGILGIADPILGLFFNRIGDKAAAGMARVLDGRRL